MNYYLRRNHADRFWFWAKAAVPMIYGDPLPLFHLCGRMNEDGALIDRLDIRKPQIQAGYLFYLLDTGRADLAGPASRRLLEGNRQVNVPVLLEACDRLLEARRVDDAAALWNGILGSRRLPFPPPHEEIQSILTNGDFAVSPSGHGFDWRLPAFEGVSAAREEGSLGLRLTFSGMQPEKADLLVQFVPVRESTGYDLKFAYRTANIEPPSGLAWEITDANRNVNVGRGADLASDEQIGQQLTFVTPPRCNLIRLSLVYQRRPGTTRITGYLIVRDVGLRPAPEVRSETVPHPRAIQ
jgi:hypothetical protein